MSLLPVLFLRIRTCRPGTPSLEQACKRTAQRCAALFHEAAFHESFLACRLLGLGRVAGIRHRHPHPVTSTFTQPSCSRHSEVMRGRYPPRSNRSLRDGGLIEESDNLCSRKRKPRRNLP